MKARSNERIPSRALMGLLKGATSMRNRERRQPVPDQVYNQEAAAGPADIPYEGGEFVGREVVHHGKADCQIGCRQGVTDGVRIHDMHA